MKPFIGGPLDAWSARYDDPILVLTLPNEFTMVRGKVLYCCYRLCFGRYLYVGTQDNASFKVKLMVNGGISGKESKSN